MFTNIVHFGVAHSVLVVKMESQNPLTLTTKVQAVRYADQLESRKFKQYRPQILELRTVLAQFRSYRLKENADAV